YRNSDADRFGQGGRGGGPSVGRTGCRRGLRGLEFDGPSSGRLRGMTRRPQRAKGTLSLVFPSDRRRIEGTAARSMCDVGVVVAFVRRAQFWEDLRGFHGRGAPARQLVPPPPGGVAAQGGAASGARSKTPPPRRGVN